MFPANAQAAQKSLIGAHQAFLIELTGIVEFCRGGEHFDRSFLPELNCGLGELYYMLSNNLWNCKEGRNGAEPASHDGSEYVVDAA
jgi:hypothetical protein